MEEKKNSPATDRDDSLLRAVKGLAILSGTGIYLACVVGICLYLGIKIDEWANIAPAGRLGGLIFGFPVGLYSLYRQIKKNGLI